MGKITALTAQKKNKDRVNVFVDGKFAFGVMAITAVRLRIGQELSPADVASLQADDTYEAAKQTALNYISYRPRSMAEVTQNLRGKSYDEPVIEQVITRLQELDLLNDTAFARYWVEQRDTFKPRSQMALRSELMQKGVDRKIIDAVVADVDETAAARSALEKNLHRWRRLPEMALRQKASAYLQRRGFSYEIVRETLDAVWEEICEQQAE